MKMSLVFGPDGTFVLEGRSVAFDQLEAELLKLPSGTSILLTFERGGDNRQSTYREVAKWIYAAGLDVLGFDVSKIVGRIPFNRAPDG
jgi:hypothetical protein